MKENIELIFRGGGVDNTCPVVCQKVFMCFFVSSQAFDEAFPVSRRYGV